MFPPETFLRDYQVLAEALDNKHYAIVSTVLTIFLLSNRLDRPRHLACGRRGCHTARRLTPAHDGCLSGFRLHHHSHSTSICSPHPGCSHSDHGPEGRARPQSLTRVAKRLDLHATRMGEPPGRTECLAITFGLDDPSSGRPHSSESMARGKRAWAWRGVACAHTVEAST